MKTKAEKLRGREYYCLAHQGSTDLTHPAMKVLLELFNSSGKVLDMGCGEGTRISTLSKDKQNKKLFAVDASKIAIKLAKESYPGINFSVGNLEKLPFKDGEFDLLYSAYVFEHLTKPEKVLIEAQRILRPGGKLMIIAPNFGSPNRRSPNSLQPKIKKLNSGLLKDLKLVLKDKTVSLFWQTVTPLNNRYTIDADTTIEPYLLTLIKYSKEIGFKIEYFSSNWSVDRFSFFQFMFRILGSLRIYPFLYWGPHLALVLKK